MVDFMTSIREKLRKYETTLNNDIDEFDKKLNTSRDDLFNYIERQIQCLRNVKRDYEKEFNYLHEENKKTSNENRMQFDNFCLLINQNDNYPARVENLLEDFERKFSLRPLMLKSIPEYYFKNIHIKDFIKDQNRDDSNFEEDLKLKGTSCDKISSTLYDESQNEENEQDHYSSHIINKLLYS